VSSDYRSPRRAGAATWRWRWTNAPCATS